MQSHTSETGADTRCMWPVLEGEYALRSHNYPKTYLLCYAHSHLRWKVH